MKTKKTVSHCNALQISITGKGIKYTSTTFPAVFPLTLRQKSRRSSILEGVTLRVKYSNGTTNKGTYNTLHDLIQAFRAFTEV